ncbi:MAG: family 43 glycosylhydrolase [Granulosicoccus sp.]|nr:family 43 glycosylhydrolase [Granulosicoccus sp.]
MAFSLEDMWVWDAWYIRDGSTIHMFFLHAPKSIGNADHRHFYASIGHAVSEDMINWAYQGPVIKPSVEPAWDDLATWTGCVVKRTDGQWMMFYTGTSRAERGHIQRIGSALSSDLYAWKKMSGQPTVTVNKNYYATLDDPRFTDEACRDPHVFRDPDGNGWHMYFTASGLRDNLLENGVIGHATSQDLETWEVQAPIFEGDLYGELEVPEVIEINGCWYLLFSTSARMISEAYRSRRTTAPETGTHYLSSTNGPLGPWELTQERFVLGDTQERYYVARKTPDPNGQLSLIAFNNLDADGNFMGGLSDPIPFGVLPDGALRATATEFT